MNQRWFTFSNLTLLLMFVITISLFNFFKFWFPHPFVSDINNYYSYLVAYFVHGDLSFSFPNEYITYTSPIGVEVQKMSMGVALVQLPFFLIGHGLAHLLDFPTNGYSTPYFYAMCSGPILYVFIGFIFLKKVLNKRFSEFAVGATLFVLYFATNLHYYTNGAGLMSHSFIFAILCAVIYLTEKYHEVYRKRYLMALSFLIGLATVVRPTQILMLFVPLFYGVNNIQTLKQKVSWLLTLKWFWLVLFVCFILPVFPQLLYWKVYAGQWLYFSYTEEGFHFDNPRFIEVLFSWRKGWFNYTPIMLFAFIALFLMKEKVFKLSFLVYFIFGLYVVSSWWCWWYGGSFGMRALVDFYPIFGFSLAWLIQSLSKRWKAKFLVAAFLLLFVSWNMWNTVQYQFGVIHHDAMTWEARKYVWNKLHLSEEERKHLNSLLDHPFDE